MSDHRTLSTSLSSDFLNLKGVSDHSPLETIFGRFSLIEEVLVKHLFITGFMFISDVRYKLFPVVDAVKDGSFYFFFKFLLSVFCSGIHFVTFYQSSWRPR